MSEAKEMQKTKNGEGWLKIKICLCAVPEKMKAKIIITISKNVITTTETTNESIRWRER